MTQQPPATLVSEPASTTSRAKRAWQRLRPAVEGGAVVALVGLIPLPTCISLLVFKVPCPACGMTRSSLALLTGDLSTSFHYQPILIPLILLCIASVPLAYFLDDNQWKQTVPE